MDLIQRQHCASREPWYAVYIPSQSEEGKKYRVMAPYPEDEAHELICECDGFLYRGHCAHQQLAFEKLCRWSEEYGPEQQDDYEKHAKVCPRCGLATIKETEWA